MFFKRRGHRETKNKEHCGGSGAIAAKENDEKIQRRVMLIDQSTQMKSSLYDHLSLLCTPALSHLPEQSPSLHFTKSLVLPTSEAIFQYHLVQLYHQEAHQNNGNLYGLKLALATFFPCLEKLLGFLSAQSFLKRTSYQDMICNLTVHKDDTKIIATTPLWSGHVHPHSHVKGHLSLDDDLHDSHTELSGLRIWLGFRWSSLMWHPNPQLVSSTRANKGVDFP
ncbi:hypothetical protein Tco_0631543 [Tanacetum coccineum]